jgi:hemerythrin superfamily protein
MNMNAVELLKNDHQTIKDILNQLSETSERAVKKRTELLARLELELTVHTAIEEEILYPAYCQAGGREQQQMYYEAKEEHRSVDSLVLPDLKQTQPGTVEFAGRVKVCKELLEHHIEEEEQEMFPQAQELLGETRLDELGQAMQDMKTRMKRELTAARKAA